MSNSDWRIARLGEVADVSWGDTSTTKSAYVQAGYVAYSATGPDGLLPWYAFDEHGIVVSAIGAQAGRTWLAKGKWSCIKNTIRVLATSPDVHVDYLYWATRGPNVWPIRGSAQPFISQADARGISLRLPSYPEQRAIAEVLGALDDKIAANTKLAQIADEFVRAEYSGLQPAGQVIIDELVNNRREAVEPSAVLPGTTYVGLEHIPRRSMWMSESGAAESVTSGKSRFTDGDILFGKLRPYFHKVVSAAGHGICSTDIIVLQTKRPGLSGFALAALTSDDVITEVTAASGGTRMPRTSWKDLAATEIPWPGDDQALQFSARVDTLRDSVMSHLAENRTLAEMRDTLLPELMSGRLRVKDAEAAASEAGL